MSANEPIESTMRVWDLPTRVFHWTLVVLIILQYATGEFGLLDMRWHFWFGYATLALLLFRVLWGFFGSQTSRFGFFLRGPRAALSYLRSLSAKKQSVVVGHNPLGAWSVVAMLACLIAQSLSGLFASDEIDTDGPFATRVSSSAVKLMTRIHHWTQTILLILIALHIVAIVLYWVLRRDNLIGPMVTGRKPMVPSESLSFQSNVRAVLLFAVSALIIAALIALGS